jgi:uncharacterized protein (TIGR00299 family) protein
MLAYFDCLAGISGDMTLGACIDLGVPPAWLRQKLRNGLPLKGYKIRVRTVTRHGLQARQVRVDVEDDRSSRNFADIQALIRDAPLSDFVKKTALDIFDRIAEAEAGIHGCPKTEVHFHEVGGVDALVDVVGTALCIEYLKIDAVVASSIPTGTGFTTVRHGTIPIPAPATLAILKTAPVYGTDVPHELTTPTGAAIVTSLADRFAPMPVMNIQKIGYGAGQRELERIPNLLRVVLGTPGAGAREETVVRVETCIDDMNPEFFGYVMERLFEDGALDVYWIPVYMKKNRPGTLVQVICPASAKEVVIERLLQETTTTGVRYQEMPRRVLERQQIHVQTSLGRVAVKRVRALDGSYRMIPEYDACRELARVKKIPLRTVYDTIVRETAGSKASRK